MTDRNPNILYPISQWHDDDGDVLWWHVPVREPPIVGSPRDTDWDNDDGYLTHWSYLPDVKEDST